MTRDTTAPPRFSIITPAYNAEPYVAAAVESVLRLDVADWEMIVVDDGSRDGTAERVASFTDPRIRLVRQDNCGQSAAQNLGLSLSRGKFLSFLDADDCYRPHALSHLHAALCHNPEACLAYGAAAYIAEDGERLSDGRRPLFARKPSGAVLGEILARNFIINGATVLARRDCVVNAGGFNPCLVMAQDWDLWCRLALEGSFVFAGHDPVLDYRVRPTSVSRSHGLTAHSQFDAIAAVFDHPRIKAALPARQLARARRMREADAWLFVATEALRARSWFQARKSCVTSLRLNKRSLRAWATLGLGILRYLPAPVRRRLGAG